MKKIKGFTLVELLVVISIIALLLAVLMPSLSKARNLGRRVVCGSNLKQWGVIVELYQNDNNRSFIAGDGTSYGWTPAGSTLPRELNNWVHLLLPYYSDFEILNCPSTHLQNLGTVSDYCRDTTTDKTFMSTSEVIYNKNGTKRTEVPVSYGLNNWMLRLITATGKDDFANASYKYYFGSTDKVQKKKNMAPVFLDCTVRAGVPLWSDKPPEFRGQDNTNVSPYDNLMRRFALVRHMGGTNALFADASMDFVGTKTLWGLNWRQNYKLYKEPVWPAWMRSMNKK